MDCNCSWIWLNLVLKTVHGLGMVNGVPGFLSVVHKLDRRSTVVKKNSEWTTMIILVCNFELWITPKWICGNSRKFCFLVAFLHWVNYRRAMQIQFKWSQMVSEQFTLTQYTFSYRELRWSHHRRAQGFQTCSNKAWENITGIVRTGLSQC